MADEQTSFEKLLELVRQKRASAADSVAYVQALQPMQVQGWMDDHAKRMGKVQDAYWASKCPDYEPPAKDDVNANFINCSITSDQAIRQIAQLVGEDPVTPPVLKPRPWWRKLLSALLLLTAVVLGAILIWLTLQWFGGQPDSYEIIAEPYQPGN